MPLVSGEISSFDDDEDIYGTDSFNKEMERRFGSRKPRDFTLPKEEEDDSLEFVKGIKAGIDQTQALAGGAKAAIGSAIGNREWVDDGLAYYQEQMREASQYAPRTAFEDEWGEDGWADGFTDFTDWLSFTAGNLVPSIAGMLGTGGIGGAVVGGVAKAAAKKAIQKKMHDTAKGIAEKQILRESQQRYVGLVAKKYTKIGAGTGAFAFSGGAGTGENFGRIYEETGLEDPGAAISLGIAMGALDLVGVPFRAFRKMFPDEPLTAIKNDLAQKALDERGTIKKMIDRVITPETRLGSIGAEALKSGVLEGVTEVAQEFLSRASVKWAAENLSEEEQERFEGYMFNEDAISSYIHAAAAGVVGGKFMGGITGAIAGPSAQGRANRELREKNKIEEEKTDTPQETDIPQETDTPQETPVFSEEQERERAKVLADKRAAASKAYDEDQGQQDQEDPLPEPMKILRQNTLDAMEFEIAPTLDTLAESNGVERGAQQEILEVMEERGEVIVDRAGDVATYELAPQEVVQDTTTQTAQKEEVTGVDEELQKEITTRLDNEQPLFTKDVVYFLEDIIKGNYGEKAYEFGMAYQQARMDAALAEREAKQATVVAETATAQEDPYAGLTGIERELARFNEPSEGIDVAATGTVNEDAGDLQSTLPVAGDLAPIDVSITDRVSEVNTQQGETQQPNGDDNIVQQGMLTFQALVQKITGIGSTAPKDRVGGKKSDDDLVSITDSFGETDSTLESSPEIKTFASVLVESIRRGLPRAALDSVAGFYGFDGGPTEGNATYVPAAYSNSTNTIAVNKADIKEAATDDQAKKQLLFAVSHELYHALDAAKNFTREMLGMRVELRRVDGVIQMDLDSLTGEMYNAYVADNELGQVFRYPFDSIAHYLANKVDGDLDRAAQMIRQELFAQAGAMYTNNPKLLKQFAPQTYKMMQDVQGDSRSLTERRDAGNTETQNTTTEARTDVPGNVRSPPVDGSNEVPDTGEPGRDSEEGGGVGGTDTGVERQGDNQDGDEAGRPVQLDPREQFEDQKNKEEIVPGETQSEIEGLQTVDLPVDELSLSEDVPQFKSGANDEGIVERLGGKFDRRGLAPIIVWERKDGRKEIISGRHRWDLAKRSGEKTIPSQVMREADGFTVQQAAILDAELNLLDGQGQVKDYVNYFQAKEITKEEALSRGLLARATGKRAYTIANEGSDELITAHRNDQITDTEAEAISQNAPGNSALQATGLKALINGAKAIEAVNVMKAVMSVDPNAVGTTQQDSLFGFDESAMQTATEMAKIVSAKQRQITADLSAITGASKKPEVAKKYGVNVKNAAALKKVIDGLKADRVAWENWHTNPELVAEINSEMTGDPDLFSQEDPDFQEIVFTDLPKPSQEVTASPILYGSETPIPIEGNPTLVKVATAFDLRASEAYGAIDLSEKTGENAEIISDLIAHEAIEALNKEGNAGEWYQEKVANAMDLAAQRFPELKTDPNAKFAFTAIMAVTSNGASVPENAANTLKLYEDYRQNQKFTVFGVGKESQAMKQSFELLNTLVIAYGNAGGVDGLRQFMDQDITVKELRDDYNLKVSGELVGTVLKGSAILGPKIGGGFFQNLNGNYDPLTMDRWFMRTWGRLTGSLMSNAKRMLPAQIEKFRELALSDAWRKKLKDDGIKRVELRKDDDYLAAYARKVQSAYAKGNFKDKNALNKASNTFAKSQSEKQAPQNGKERKYIREVMTLALTKVNKFMGNKPVNMGALQAIIWYPEKELYKLHGVGNAKSEPTDYETEFRKIIEGQDSGQELPGSDGPAQQSGAGGVQRGTSVPRQDETQPDSTEGQEPSSEKEQELTRPSRDRTRDPDLQRAVQARIDRQVTAQELNETFEDKGRPVLDMTPEQVPDLVSDEKAVAALTVDKRELWNQPLEEGVRYGSRLDIPASDRPPAGAGPADIVTVHTKKANAQSPSANKKISHMKTIRMTNVEFAVPQKGAKKIALGAQKNTIATIEGDYVKKTDEENHAEFKALINDPDWTQVSMNPIRHSHFYRLSDQYPVVTADEVIQVGNLAIAKNVNKDSQPEVDDFLYMKLEGKHTPGIAFNINDEVDAQRNTATVLTKYFPRKWVSAVQDKFERWDTIENAMAATLGKGKLSAEESFRSAENLMHSQLQEQLIVWGEKYIDPIAELTKKYGFSADQIGAYLLAKHAPERNAAMKVKEEERKAVAVKSLEKQIEESESEVTTNTLEEQLQVLEDTPLRFQENGSGVTNDEAAELLRAAEEAGTASQFEEISTKVYKMLDDMRQNMVDKGLLDEESKRDWEETYEFYVPLRGFADPEDLALPGGGKTKGFSITGPESMKARGRLSLPKNPLLMAFISAQEKIIRAEKNRVAQRLLKLVERFDSTDKETGWTVYNAKFRPDHKDPVRVARNERMTLQEMQDAKMLKYPALNRFVQVKRGGQTFFIEFRDPVLNAQVHDANSMTLNTGNAVMDAMLKTGRKINNFRRKMTINYNPSWGLVNPIRDIETGLAFLLSEQQKVGGRVKGKDLVGKVMAGWLDSGRAFWRHSLKKEPQNDKQKEIFQYIDDYIADGAPTGLATMKDLDELRRDFEKELGPQPLKVGNVHLPSALDARAVFRKSLEWFTERVESFNQATENAIRLSTYIEARKSGTARLDAATLAKDLTVNFNRKGEYSSQIDSMYLFFNAALQGNVNMKDALVGSASKQDKATLLGIAATRRLFFGLISFGIARTMMNVFFADEDDDGESKYKDFNPYVLGTSAAFMGSDWAVGVPIPYGWGWADNVGRLIGEQMMGVKEPEVAAAELFGLTLHHFSPRGFHAVKEDNDSLGQAFIAGSSLIPDVGTFFVEQAGDVNFFGSPIVTPSPYTNYPASETAKRGTMDGFKSFARMMNSLTGGSKEVSGGIDISPDRLQHIFDFALGGLGRFGTDTADVIQKSFVPESEVKGTDIPILRRFYFNPSEYTDQFQYYDNRTELSQEMDGWKNADRQGQAALAKKRSRQFYTQLDAFRKATDKKLRKNRQAIRSLERAFEAATDDQVEDRLKARLERVQNSNQLLYDRFNKRFRELK